MFYSASYPSPVGLLTLVSDGENLTGLFIEGQKYFGGAISGETVKREDLPVFCAVKGWLDRYFSGGRPGIRELPLRPIGGEFRRAVWKELMEIPYGEVVTYGFIAKRTAVRLGRQTLSAQAVGGAVGHNPISIVIPCHRVVGANGSLTGYAGGIEKKVKLLKLEGADLSRLFVPKKGTAL